MSLWNNFWEVSISIEEMMLQFGLIMIVMLISNIIRRKVNLVRKSLLPTAAIGGILILILKQIPGISSLFSDNFMELITYHSLAIGCIAIALKSTSVDHKKKKTNKVMDAGLITVNTYLIQGIIGAAITVVLYVTFMSDTVSLFVSGMLLPLGYGQGSGQALNFGQIYESQWGLVGGASLGLTIAAIGFLAACFVGVYHLNKLKRKGLIKNNDGQEAVFISNEETASPNDVALSESIDRFTIQVALIVIVYFAVYLFFIFISRLPNNGFLGNTLKPLIFGFNFLFGTVFATIVQVVCKKLRKVGWMTKVYPNNYLLNRISGFTFDVMIIAGIGAIEISVIGDLLIPLVLICGIGLYVTYKYVYYVSKKTFPDYPEEAFVSLFGMLTGTNSTGIILLREIDPQFQTPAATNLILQSIYAIAFGFPLLLLLGVAPQSVTMTIVSIGVMIVMFIAFNVVLFRSRVFAKRKKAPTKSGE